MFEVMHCFPPRRRAFSLIELVVVMAILGVVAAIAVPKLSDAAAGQRAEMAALRLATDLSMVREMARAQSRSFTVTFDSSTMSYAIKGDTATVVSLAREPYGLSGLRASFGESGANELTVDGFGRWTASGEAKVFAGSRVASVAITSESVAAGAEREPDAEIKLDLGLGGVSISLGGGGGK